MIGIGIANATATSSYLSSQLPSSANDTILKKVLKECADKYSYAGDALQASVQDLAVESYDYAYMHIMAAADYPNGCHNAFKRYPGLAYPPEIARREKGLKQICDVVLGIVDLLGSVHQLLDNHFHYVQGVAWDPLNKYVASLSSDRTCRVYINKPQTKTKGFEKINYVCQHVITKTEHQLADDSKSSKNHLFHDETLPSFFRRLAWSPDGSFLLVPAGSYKMSPASDMVNTAYAFSRKDFSRPALMLPGASKPVVAVRFCPMVFSPRGLHSAGFFKLPYRLIFAVATLNSLSSNAQYLAVSSQDGYCTLVEFETNELGLPIPSAEHKKDLFPENKSPIIEKREDIMIETPVNDGFRCLEFDDFGFGKNGFYAEALNLFRDMIAQGVKVDVLTIPSILNACGGGGDLMKVKEIHGQVVKSILFNEDVAIGNSLIDLYAKCCLGDSEKVFQNMHNLNVVTWTTMISSYGVHGKGENHSGLIDQGRVIFSSIWSDYGFEPCVEHCACMVDLLSRCGHLEEALGLAQNMKLAATASIWGALLAGCLMHKNVKIGEIAAHHLYKLEPRNPSNYVALSCIYESQNIWDGLTRTRTNMRELGLVKTPGCSWITIAGMIHKFYQGDYSHPSTKVMCETLDDMIKVLALPNVFKQEH
ncbi:hypothetical protein GH714_021606 [Hevea brasiliensis]|uniref:Pectinesterase inhibitor domain-containing protein n=1 Tax=Hevea brasiliensis TaxID=3981 RepID=A0A6A6K7C7_HEVBR|nr:hypothetical protein GH714_021606 [Hevea brasiliensis]